MFFSGRQGSVPNAVKLTLNDIRVSGAQAEMMVPPSTELWKELIATWKRMNQKEPWKWLDPHQLIGVVDPFTQEVGLCRFVGQRPEEVPGMVLLLGSPGLAGFIAERNRPDMDPLELMTVRSQLEASTSNKCALERHETDAIKRLRLMFRGNWPLFRAQDLGYMPCALDFEEARTLLLAMEQALDVAERARKDPDLIRSWNDVTQPIFTRASKIEGDRILWIDGRWQPQPVMTQVSSLPDELIDEFKKTMRKKPRGTGTWYLGCPYLLSLVDEESHGRFRIARSMVFIDVVSNETVKLSVYGKDMDVMMPLSLIDGLMASKEIPKTLLVSDDFSEALVSEIVPRLGVKVQRTDGYPEAVAAANRAALDCEKEQMEANEKEDAARKKRKK
jgi:hypothetical protein